MSEVKHTEGPYEAVHASLVSHVFSSGGVDGGGLRLADFHQYGQGTLGRAEREANASLFAAAPDMFAFILDIAKRDPVFAKGWEKQHIKDAAALIAKAEGRSS